MNVRNWHPQLYNKTLKQICWNWDYVGVIDLDLSDKGLPTQTA